MTNLNCNDSGVLASILGDRMICKYFTRVWSNDNEIAHMIGVWSPRYDKTTGIILLLVNPKWDDTEYKTTIISRLLRELKSKPEGLKKLVIRAESDKDPIMETIRKLDIKRIHDNSTGCAEYLLYEF